MSEEGTSVSEVGVSVYECECASVSGTHTCNIVAISEYKEAASIVLPCLR